MPRIRVDDAGKQVPLEDRAAGRFLFRSPTELDIWKLYERTPIMAEVASGKAFAGGAPSTLRERAAVVEFCDRLIVACAIAPKFLAEPVENTGDREVVVEWPIAWRELVGAALMKAAGFTAEEAADLGNSDGESQPSDSSTSSGTDTGNVLAPGSAGSTPGKL